MRPGKVSEKKDQGKGRVLEIVIKTRRKVERARMMEEVTGPGKRKKWPVKRGTTPDAPDFGERQNEIATPQERKQSFREKH